LSTHFNNQTLLLNPDFQYSGRENLELEHDIDVCVAKLIQLVGSYADNHNQDTFDLAKKLQFLTLDVIGLVGFGKSFGLLDIDDDPDEFSKCTLAEMSHFSNLKRKEGEKQEKKNLWNSL
jgi:hypothetical protein